MINDFKKLEATLNCIKDSEIILGGEYYIVHSDYIIALEEEIKKYKNTDIVIKVENIEEIKEYINKLQERIDKAIERIEKELSYTPSSTRKKVGLILIDYKKLLDILKGNYDKE